MFTKPIFETLPIVFIALGILLIAFVHHPLALAAGAFLILSSGFVIYRYYTDLGTDADAFLDEHRTV